MNPTRDITADEQVSQYISQFSHCYTNSTFHTTRNMGELKVSYGTRGTVTPTWSVMVSNSFARIVLVDHVEEGGSLGITIRGHSPISLATHLIALSLAAQELNLTRLAGALRKEVDGALHPLNSFVPFGRDKAIPIHMTLTASSVVHPYNDGLTFNLKLAGCIFNLRLSPNTLLPIAGSFRRELAEKLSGSYQHTIYSSNSWRSAMIATNLVVQGREYVCGLNNKPELYDDFEEVPF